MASARPGAGRSPSRERLRTGSPAGSAARCRTGPIGRDDEASGLGERRSYVTHSGPCARRCFIEPGTVDMTDDLSIGSGARKRSAGLSVEPHRRDDHERGQIVIDSSSVSSFALEAGALRHRYVFDNVRLPISVEPRLLVPIPIVGGCSRRGQRPRVQVLVTFDVTITLRSTFSARADGTLGVTSTVASVQLSTLNVSDSGSAALDSFLTSADRKPRQQLRRGRGKPNGFSNLASNRSHGGRSHAGEHADRGTQCDHRRSSGDCDSNSVHAGVLRASLSVRRSARPMRARAPSFAPLPSPRCLPATGWPWRSTTTRSTRACGRSGIGASWRFRMQSVFRGPPSLISAMLPPVLAPASQPGSAKLGLGDLDITLDLKLGPGGDPSRGGPREGQSVLVSYLLDGTVEFDVPRSSGASG